MRVPAILAAGLFFLFLVPFVHAEDWTIKGKTYQNVQVNKVELNTVSIMYDGGITHLSWNDLTPDIQKELGQQHDPLVTAVKDQQDAQAAEVAATAKAEAEQQQQQEALEKKAKSDLDSLDKATVTGQVFIVTQGGENVKLGSIHVYLYSEEEVAAVVEPLMAKAIATAKELEPTLTAQRANCEAALQAKNRTLTFSFYANAPGACTRAQWLEPWTQSGPGAENFGPYRATLTKYYSCFSKTYYIQALPTPLADAQTDADGKFSMQIPKTGSWVLEAEGERSVGDKTESYFWLVKVGSDAIAKNQIFLTNENLSTSGSSDSLVSTIEQSKIDEEIKKKLDLASMLEEDHVLPTDDN